jgi:hypothetical protein
MEFSVTGRLIPRHDIKVGDALVTGTPTTRLKQSPFPIFRIFRMVIRDSWFVIRVGGWDRYQIATNQQQNALFCRTEQRVYVYNMISTLVQQSPHDNVVCGCEWYDDSVIRVGGWAVSTPENWEMSVSNWEMSVSHNNSRKLRMVMINQRRPVGAGLRNVCLELRNVSSELRNVGGDVDIQTFKVKQWLEYDSMYWWARPTL